MKALEVKITQYFFLAFSPAFCFAAQVRLFFFYVFGIKRKRKRRQLVWLLNVISVWNNGARDSTAFLFGVFLRIFLAAKLRLVFFNLFWIKVKWKWKQFFWLLKLISDKSNEAYDSTTFVFGAFPVFSWLRSWD